MPTPSSSRELQQQCQICGQAAHGNHFGAISCRACAAFFRRGAKHKTDLEKCAIGNCKIYENGKFYCKKCRLKRCFEVGMDSSKFQFDRDILSTSSNFVSGVSKKPLGPPISFSSFLGRPSFILLCEPQKAAHNKAMIDVTYLIERALQILAEGPSTPYIGNNSLERMSLNFADMRRRNSTAQFTKIEIFGKTECIEIWEKDFLTVANWLTHFDEVQQLPIGTQMEMLKLIWVLWNRLEKLAKTADYRRRHQLDKNCFFISDEVCIDVKNYDIDVSWFTHYSKEQLKYYIECSNDNLLDKAVQWMIDLRITDIELNYMFCQLSLQYVTNHFRGKMEEICEKLMDTQSNNLHDFYIKILKMPNYSGRVAKMMKIVNMIMEDLRQRKDKAEVARLFNIISVEFSHPEMFGDTGC